MRIEVTREHICKGEIEEPTCCPIALALVDCGLRTPAVYDNVVFHDRHKNRWMVPVMLPPEAVEFIHNFDSGTPVEPFGFNLEIE